MPFITQGVYITTSDQLATGVVTSDKIAADTIAATDIAPNAVEDSEVAAHTTTKITVPVGKVSGTMPLNQGGTGQTTKAAAFDALAPTANRGDIIYKGATNNEALAPGTAGYFLKTMGNGADPQWADAAGAASLAIVPIPAFPSVAVANATLNGNTVMNVYKAILTRPITVNKITFNVGAKTTNGTYKIAVYSADGATKYIEVTSGTITGTGLQSVAVSSVTLPAGEYWIGFLPVSTVNCQLETWTPLISWMRNVASEEVLTGTIAVTADTIPETLTLASISVDNLAVDVRLDN